jgi:hypothetical protein
VEESSRLLNSRLVAWCVSLPFWRCLHSGLLDKKICNTIIASKMGDENVDTHPGRSIHSTGLTHLIVIFRQVYCLSDSPLMYYTDLSM